MILVIMAAGMGSRYGGLKQLDPIGPGGEFILDYSIYDAKAAGFDKVVFIIRKENLELFRETVGKRIENVIKVEYVFQEVADIPAGITILKERKKPWGTAHAVYCCRHVLDDDFAVINADDFYGRESFKLVADYMRSVRSENSAPGACLKYCMAGYRLENTLTENGHVSRGVCSLNDNGTLTTIVEHRKIKKEADGKLYNTCENGELIRMMPDTPVSMNCWGFTPRLFDFLEDKMRSFFADNAASLQNAEYYLLSVIQDYIDCGVCEVRVLDTPAKWFGVTYREDRPAVVEAINQLILRGDYPEYLWK